MCPVSGTTGSTGRNPGPDTMPRSEPVVPAHSAARVARWLVPSAGGLGVLFVVGFMFVMQFRFLADSDASAPSTCCTSRL